MSKPQIRLSYDDNIQISLGERKYSTYLEALNESIRNSLDNKSSEIDVNITKDKIVIEDNGTGLDEKAFNEEYFRIGKLNPDPNKGGLFGIGVL